MKWWEETWNPVIGCSPASPGCDNCYAARNARVRGANPVTPQYAGLVGADGKWTGETRFVQEQLLKPLSWRKGKRIFVCSMGDLFHPSVPFEWVDKVFAVMALCPQHTFVILTKRPERMREYLAQMGEKPRPAYITERELWAQFLSKVAAKLLEGSRTEYRMVRSLAVSPKHDSIDKWSFPRDAEYFVLNTIRGCVYDVRSDHNLPGWPLQNVWMLTTVEHEDYFMRVYELLATPAAKRGISVEPMLDIVELDGASGLDWVICGGETGRHARPLFPEAPRILRDQCAEEGIPFFFKQWGEFLQTTEEKSVFNRKKREFKTYPAGALLERVGARRAGHLIDGVEHLAIPEAHHG